MPRSSARAARLAVGARRLQSDGSENRGAAGRRTRRRRPSRDHGGASAAPAAASHGSRRTCRRGHASGYRAIPRDAVAGVPRRPRRACAPSRPPCNATVHPQDPARRLAAGARKVGPTDAERPAVRGEPQVRASSAMPSSGRLSAPLPLGITPTSFNAALRPRLGKPRVVAHCRLARPDARAVFLHPQVDGALGNWRALSGRDRVVSRF